MDSSKKDANPVAVAYVKFKNDDQRLREEWDLLPFKNHRLHELLIDLAQYVQNTFKKELIVTMIYRTPEEQASIYKDDAKFKAKPFKSPHQFWHSADIRSKTFTADEIKKIEDYLNTKYKNINYYGWTAKNHNVGLGDHFHIQIAKK